MSRKQIGLSSARSGFSLMELLVVVAIMGIMAAIAIPAVSSIGGASKFSSNLDRIKSAVDFARQEAVSKNTYSWLLFYPSTDDQGIDQLTLAIVSSKEGTDPISWGTYANAVPDSVLELATRIVTLPQIRLNSAGTFSSTQISTLPSSATSTNDVNESLGVKIKIPGRTSTVTFAKGIRFSPGTGAANGDSTPEFIEVDVQLVKGKAADTKNVAVIRINSVTGLAQVYRP